MRFIIYSHLSQNNFFKNIRIFMIAQEEDPLFRCKIICWMFELCRIECWRSVCLWLSMQVYWIIFVIFNSWQPNMRARAMSLRENHWAFFNLVSTEYPRQTLAWILYTKPIKSTLLSKQIGTSQMLGLVISDQAI